MLAGLKPLSGINRPHFVAGGGGLGGGLDTDLVHFLNLDESSGNAVDSVGAVTFTDTNTVTANATGAPDGGGCRVFTRANNEHFAAASGDVFDWTSGDAMSLACWFKSPDIAFNRYIYGHNASAGYSASLLTNAGFSYNYLDAALFFKLTAYDDDSWHSFVVTSTGNSGTPVDKIWIDGTNVVSSAKGFEPGAAAFYIGADQSGTSSTQWDGSLCSFGIWRDRVLDSDDAAAWHNSGTNLRYT